MAHECRKFKARCLKTAATARCAGCGAVPPNPKHGLCADWEPGGRRALAEAFLRSMALPIPQAVRGAAALGCCCYCVGHADRQADADARRNRRPAQFNTSQKNAVLVLPRRPGVCGCLACLLPPQWAPAPAVPAVPGRGARRAAAGNGSRWRGGRPGGGCTRRYCALRAPPVLLSLHRSFESVTTKWTEQSR